MSYELTLNSYPGLLFIKRNRKELRSNMQNFSGNICKNKNSNKRTYVCPLMRFVLTFQKIFNRVDIDPTFK